MAEGDNHYKAKCRARSILGEILDCQVTSIEEPQQGESFGEEKSWSLDAYGELTIKIGIEIDGKVGHGTKKTIAKDKYRNGDNLKRNKVYTVRFKTRDFIGKNSLTSEEIISEIQYSLNKQGLALLRGPPYIQYLDMI
jgi:hypothetical protein